ncbi:Transmembrane nucleoporin [Yamadazyma tenuis]|uniref:Pore membrane protein of 33 kDa n=1 Tax=Candida tenuis (strain ATCC 10573 / BCRC 21748 / CBS 615 / JCM 9827 / NBRC 10315 / NRRL Y-1498 / VKM Y-70) TaxID=590646 RepID=G3B4J6_CANTC|nr:uncharacterized protein CANTEDRAFT_105671 [Yamadazyma tenuis ATCC 10573]EGV63962.1 hypothetical protein CANTEDRAFT_105671 [Yamadazyma tenuis ATCC 10573]WEJ96423.1 Transmembrane nucleoporin [Yamadazyma tenuis]
MENDSTKQPPQSASGPSKSTVTGASSTSKVTGSINKEQLASTIKTLQFAWFVGHVFTLLGVFFYFTVAYFKFGKKIYWFYFDLATVGIIQSFGILVYQLVKKQGFNVKTLIKDDNVHFLGLGIMFLILRPYIILPYLPFQLFSLFHVLTYSKAYLLPIFNLGETSKPYTTIDKFVAQNNGKSIQLAGFLELISLAFLFARVLLFRKRSLTPFLVYLIFIKLRYEKSVVTRNHVKTLEVRIDGLINNLNNPGVKNVWIKVKGAFSKVGSFILVNDYKKNKVN